MLGDLNDEPDAATAQVLHGPLGSEIGTAGYEQPDQGDGARLWNLAARIPEAERSSRIYRGRRELIDHILVSHKVTRAVADGDVTTGPVPDSIDDDPNTRRNDPVPTTAPSSRPSRCSPWDPRAGRRRRAPQDAEARCTSFTACRGACEPGTSLG